MHFKISCFEVKKIGDENWQEVAEKIVLEKLADCFDPLTPIINQMLEGKVVVTEQGIYRIKS